MTTTKIKASEVNIGDKIHFPNSRKPQAVETIEQQGDNINFVAGDAKWLVPADWDIRKEDEPSES